MTAVLVLALTFGSVGSVSGDATWLNAAPGTAAAGPALRQALGPHWRGVVVTVSANGHAIRVKLADWMRADRLIDLSAASFRQLAPLSQGVVTVTVSWGQPTITPPPTDEAPDWAYWHGLVL